MARHGRYIGIIALLLVFATSGFSQTDPQSAQPDPHGVCRAQWWQFDNDVAGEKADHPHAYYIEPDSDEVLIKLQFQDFRCSTLGGQPCSDHAGEHPVRTNLIIYNQSAGGQIKDVFVSYETSSFNQPDKTAETDAVKASALPYGESVLSVRHQTQGLAARHYSFRIGGPVFQPAGGWSELKRALGLGSGFRDIPGITPKSVYRSARHKPPCPRPK